MATKKKPVKLKPGIYGLSPLGNLIPLEWHQEPDWPKEQLVSMCMQVSLYAKVVMVRATSGVCETCQGTGKEAYYYWNSCRTCEGRGLTGEDGEMMKRLRKRGYWNVEVRDGR